MFRLRKYDDDVEREVNRWRCGRGEVILFDDDTKDNEVDEEKEKEAIVANDCRRESIAQEAFFIVVVFTSFCVFIGVNVKAILFSKKSSSLSFIFKDCFNCLLKLLVTRFVKELFRLSICCFRIEIARRICEFMSLLLSFRRASTSMTKKM